MNPKLKLSIILILAGIVCALTFDALDYHAHGDGWHRVQSAGFTVERNNVWWNLLK